ncbi:hypothetical protein [Streptomyces sp. NBC_00448]|uniref:hypothetical protein n=1 Tax=Streptomyces sp. NBC_00448 TaxID=2903652 RepID=UPI002E236874
MIGTRTSRRHSVLAAAALGALGVSLLSGCSSKKPAPTNSYGSPISIQSACDRSFDTQGAAALREITGKNQLYPALAAEQHTAQQVANELRADLDDTDNMNEHDLCFLGVVGGLMTSGLEIQFQWSSRKPSDKDLKSGDDFTAFGIAYGALSFDNGTYLDFTCSLPGALAGESRTRYVEAYANTSGLSAVGSAEKREAGVRLLYSPAVKVAAALGCQGSDLPPTLGTLKPLPMKKK